MHMASTASLESGDTGMPPRRGEKIPHVHPRGFHATLTAVFQPIHTIPETPSVDRMLEILRVGSEQARRDLMDLLPHINDEVRHDLRVQLTRTLREQLRPSRESDSDRPESWSRSWQVSVLVAITDEDPKARELLTQYTDRSLESNHWVRYWVLATAHDTSEQSAWALARSKELRGDTDEHLLVRCLTWAIGAKAGHQPSVAALLWALDGSTNPFPVPDDFLVPEWADDSEDPHLAIAAALRALRSVPLLPAFDQITELIDRAVFASHTWDALWVMGKFRDTPRAREASHTLARFIVSRRRDRRYYDMVGFAVRAMGTLDVPQTELLIEELGNPSPGVFVESARALERLLGGEQATNAVLHAAENKPGKVARYADALRVMKRKDIVGALDKHLHCGNRKREEVARTLFVELGGRSAFDRLKERHQTLDQRREFAEELDKRHREHIKLIAFGDGVATWISVAMTVAVFALGLLATGAGVYMLMFSTKLTAWQEWALTGSGGLFTVLAKLRFNGQVVETAGARAAARLAIFNAYQRRLQQVELILSQRFLDGRRVEFDELERFSALVADIQQETQTSLLELIPTGKDPAMAPAPAPAPPASQDSEKPRLGSAH